MSIYIKCRKCDSACLVGCYAGHHLEYRCHNRACPRSLSGGRLIQCRPDGSIKFLKEPQGVTHYLAPADIPAPRAPAPGMPAATYITIIGYLTTGDLHLEAHIGRDRYDIFLPHSGPVYRESRGADRVRPSRSSSTRQRSRAEGPRQKKNHHPREGEGCYYPPQAGGPSGPRPMPRGPAGYAGGDPGFPPGPCYTNYGPGPGYGPSHGHGPGHDYAPRYGPGYGPDPAGHGPSRGRGTGSRCRESRYQEEPDSPVDPEKTVHHVLPDGSKWTITEIETGPYKGE